MTEHVRREDEVRSAKNKGKKRRENEEERERRGESRLIFGLRFSVKTISPWK
jgi:hypothetical protein